jgi:hypothetical protein
MDCFARALNLALNASGVGFGELICSKLPKPTPHQNVIEICSNLGLEVYTSGDVIIDKRPTIVGYYLNLNINTINLVYGNSTTGVNAHAVYCSDLLPFINHKLYIVIKGFDNLTRIWHNDFVENRLLLILDMCGKFYKGVRIGSKILNLESCRFHKLKTAVSCRYL